MQTNNTFQFDTPRRGATGENNVGDDDCRVVRNNGRIANRIMSVNVFGHL